ncbi:unnamed protein product [Diplocarpon coronariae]
MLYQRASTSNVPLGPVSPRRWKKEKKRNANHNTEIVVPGRRMAQQADRIHGHHCAMKRRDKKRKSRERGREAGLMAASAWAAVPLGPSWSMHRTVQRTLQSRGEQQRALECKAKGSERERERAAVHNTQCTAAQSQSQSRAAIPGQGATQGLGGRGMT